MKLRYFIPCMLAALLGGAAYVANNLLVMWIALAVFTASIAADMGETEDEDYDE